MKPWNLNQIDIKDKEAFKRLLIDILNEGRKLTPMEIAKVELFLQKTLDQNQKCLNLFSPNARR